MDNRVKLNSFRFTLLYMGIAFLLSVLFFRLSDIQVWRSEFFLAQAEGNRFFTMPIKARRGVFLDRYGQPMVWNRRTYAEALSPTALYSLTEPIDRERALSLMATDSARLRTDSDRWYRFPESLALTVGYVGPVTADDIKEDSQLKSYHVLGKLGLEKYFDRQLRGQDGKQVFEINARLQRQRIVEQVPDVPGLDIQTTIDPYLTEIVYQALGDRKGVVVISNTQTGELLTLVAKPSFDANILSQHTGLSPQQEELRKQQVQALFLREDKPFFNRAVSGNYPPGSVFKIVTALAGLESGAFDQSTTVVDEGVLKVGEYQYGNWYFRQFGKTEGTISVIRALARSNDIFFYKAAEWVGIEKLADMARHFGFGVATGVELQGEARGIVPDPTWKQTVLKEPWYLGNTYHMGIGQGDLLVSPIQINQLVQTVGHEGVICQPHLVQLKESNCRSLSITKEHLDLVLEGMIQACSPGGTAYPFFERNAAVAQETLQSVSDEMKAGKVACKTGTAEFGGADERGYRKTHGWFVAIVEPELDKSLAAELISPAASSSATVTAANTSASATTSATIVGSSSLTDTVERSEWLSLVAQKGFPQELAITVMVESDEGHPFKEGSKDAAPVAKAILDWIEGK